MRVKVFCGGEMTENCYYAESDQSAVVVDPGFPIAFSEEELKKIKGILLTHGHFDHVSHALAIREKTGAPIFIHEADGDFLTDISLNLGFLSRFGCPSFEADVLLKDGESFSAGDLTFTLHHTPGHTRGSSCYFAENCLFTGDTLMHGGMGRIDFPTGNGQQMRASMEKLSLFPNEVKIYPGHGPETDFAAEKKINYYLRSY